MLNSLSGLTQALFSETLISDDLAKSRFAPFCEIINFWDIRNHDPPAGKNSEIQDLKYDDAYSQILFFDV